MGLLKPAENSIGFLKEGLFGFQGSGKTYTAVVHAIGLWKALTAKGLNPGPVAMFDTERGADFAIPMFSKAGIPFHVFRGRAFESLLRVIDEALEAKFSIVIIDSVTHVWRDIMDSYCKKHNIRGKIQFQHWGSIKAEWSGFTDRMVNSQIHMFVCGRAGYEYDFTDEIINEDGSREKAELIKTGTKMKAEGEFGFEPSIVFEMTRVRFNEEGEEVGAKARRAAHGHVIEKHRAYCVKDRNMDPETTMDGKVFDNPGFEVLLPHLACLNIGGRDEGIDTETDSQGMLEDVDRSISENRQRRKVLIEEIQGELQLAFPGSGAVEKQARMAIAKALLGTLSETALDRKALGELEDARTGLNSEIDGYCSDHGLIRANVRSKA